MTSTAPSTTFDKPIFTLYGNMSRQCQQQERVKMRCEVQVSLLRSKFDEALGERARQLVDVSTIDGFQVNLGTLSSHLHNYCSSNQLFKQQFGPHKL